MNQGVGGPERLKPLGSLHCLGGIKDGEAKASRAFSIVYNALEGTPTPKTQLDSQMRILKQC